MSMKPEEPVSDHSFVVHEGMTDLEQMRLTMLKGVLQKLVLWPCVIVLLAALAVVCVGTLISVLNALFANG